MNNIITASRMNCLLRCQRQHFWRYEVGLNSDSSTRALRFGSAWAVAMESRWRGKSYDDALADSIPEGVELDAYDCATLAALLAGYYDYYGDNETVGKLEPEVEFIEEKKFKPFVSRGKIDGLGSLTDGRTVLIEAKTTADSLEPDSHYWLRLKFNVQVFNYVLAARDMGWDVSEVYYDVTRKPSIKPKEVCDLDRQGKKIVLDANNRRVFVGKKKEPRQTGDKAKGYVVKSHVETPDEFCDRLWRDTLSRPAFYFCRREMPILESDLESFMYQRSALLKLITHLRSTEDPLIDKRDMDAWPRNVSRETCNFCQFQSFCLQNINIDTDNPPQGFRVMPFNPELKEYDTEPESNATT